MRPAPSSASPGPRPESVNAVGKPFFSSVPWEQQATGTRLIKVKSYIELDSKVILYAQN